jgi:oligoendopeptidase F
VATRTFPPPARRFVPETVNPGKWSDLEPLFVALEERSLASVDDFRDWIHDMSELESILRAEEARRYIDMTCHTDDEERRSRFLEFCRDIESKSKAAFDRLDRIYLASEFRSELPTERFEVFDRTRKSDVEIFREANIPLEVRETEKATEYVQLMGSLMVELNGEQVPFAKAYLELEQPDRSRRESIWRKLFGRRYEERETIEAQFSSLFDIRQEIATNSGFDSYRDYRFRHFRRFDYGVEHCEQFHAGVRSVVVPEIRRLNEIRREKLGLDTLRLWDMEVSPYSSEPYRPFKTEKELCDLARTLFGAVATDFKEEFSALEGLDLLDLFSRPNKAPGGYQYFLDDVRLPFIFANAAGTHDDVQTLLHEGGHAFHSLANRDEPISLYRDPPLEFCEVASMGMEFLALEHLEEVYDEDVAARVRCQHLEKSLRLLAWVATVDSFQHCVFTQKKNSAADRRATWVRLRTEYFPDLDWSGIEHFREVEWHRQGHIFRQPFYYIEYGIALLGALQLWVHARKDADSAVARFREALALGGSRPLPELFAAAGLRFEFGEELLRPIVEETVAEWEKLRAQI